jgi:hypothetical protein
LTKYSLRVFRELMSMKYMGYRNVRVRTASRADIRMPLSLTLRATA